jgi:transcriptional regulator
MYNPASFAVDDRTKLHDFIAQHSFATLVSFDGTTPFASHIPLLIDRDAGTHGRLVGHVARANPQWKHAAERQVLAIFHGPHAYVSPAWYEAANVVPTWNYVAVHASGTLRIVEQRDELRQIVARMVDVYESSQDAGFIDRLLESIVGFTIEIERLAGKWKLSQNHPPERREKVRLALQQSGRAEDQQLAALMAPPPAWGDL